MSGQKTTESPRRFEGRTAMVTGGSRGIGRGVALALAREGALVGLGYSSNETAAAQVKAEIEAAGGECLLLQGDVRDAERMAANADTLVQARDRIDVLVNCAGIIEDGLTPTMDPQVWARVIDTNLTGTFNAARAVARRMMRQRNGRIVNVSSISSRHGRRGQANYSASKAGVEAFTRVLALELGGKGVTVNAVCPGFIETDMTESVVNMSGESLDKRIPLRRLGQPEDVAKTVLFLASDDAAYITGQCLAVDGGLSLGLGF